MNKILTETEVNETLNWKRALHGDADVTYAVVTGVGHKTHVSYLVRYASGNIRVSRPECGSEKFNSNPNTTVLNLDGEVTCGKCKRYERYLGR